MACVIMYHSVSLLLDAVCSSTGSTWQVNAITNVVFAVCTQMWKRYSLWRIGLFRMLCFRLVLLQEVTAAWCRYVSCLAFPTWFCFTFVHTGFHHMSEVMCPRWGTVSVHHFAKKMHDSLPDWVKDCLGSKATVKGFSSVCAAVCLSHSSEWHKSSAMNVLHSSRFH